MEPTTTIAKPKHNALIVGGVLVVLFLLVAAYFIYQKINKSAPVTEVAKPKAVELSPEQRNMVLHSSNTSEKPDILSAKSKQEVMTGTNKNEKAVILSPEEQQKVLGF